MVQEVQEKMGIQARVKMRGGGHVELRSGPHPFDREKGQSNQRTRSTHSPDNRSSTLFFFQIGKEIQFLLQSPAKSADLKTGPTSADASDDYPSCQISCRSCYLLRFVFLLLLHSKQWSPGAENASTHLLIMAILKSLLNKADGCQPQHSQPTAALVLVMLALI